ncbi:MAG TPA: hypothetical protein PKD84_09630 [Propionicimonas sp.]|nr:hypothetical protein [Propionicimonas sp.]
MIPALTVDYCGEEYLPDPAQRFTIGREGDLMLDDDNPFLHRLFLVIYQQSELWWLENVGSQLSATVADGSGTFQAWLAPGARLPLVFPSTVIWFTAGPTTYEFDLHVSEVPFERVPITESSDGQVTLGPVTLTGEQKLLLVALCEDLLSRRKVGAGAVPQSGQVSKRLEWSVTKFNRKLDLICEKFTEAGVQGLRGGVAGAASSRKARLIEYAMAARIVTVDDLELLPPRRR